MEQFITKQEAKLYAALDKLICNAISNDGVPKKPTAKQLFAAKKALTNYDKYEREYNHNNNKPHQVLTFKELSDKQLKQLAQLRLKHTHAGIKQITKIVIDSIYRERDAKEVFAVSYIIYSKVYANFRLSIVFDKFYPDEFLYLQQLGIKF